jgi:integrase/recombinase XerC
MFELMRYSMRVGEVVGRNRLRGIRVCDLRENGVRVLGKGTLEVDIPIPKRVMRELRGYVSGNGYLHSTDRIFPISEQTVEVSIKRYARRVGITDYRRVTPHRLRAFFATDARDRGFDALTIRDLMRHAKLSTTDGYVGRATPSQLQSAVEKLGSKSL